MKKNSNFAIIEHNSIYIMTEYIQDRIFSQISLDDSFFDSLKEDYPNFSEWFERKKDESAFVQYSEGNKLLAFLYIKKNLEMIPEEVTPIMEKGKWMKVGTFKIDAHNTKLGERFVKKITDRAVYEDVDYIYVTIFPKQIGLINLLSKYGFENKGKKGGELVLVKNMRTLTGDILKDFPLITKKGNDKYLLSIYPKYHTRLFPDSILNNEKNVRDKLIKDVSHTNGIHKIYICSMPDASKLKRGDLLAIYRTSDRVGLAKYRSIVSSICQVEEIRIKDSFESKDEFIRYTNAYSLFDLSELTKLYNKPNIIVIKMIYNIALNKRVTRGFLLDEVKLSSSVYWGFFKLKDEVFDAILNKGEVDENIIID